MRLVSRRLNHPSSLFLGRPDVRWPFRRGIGSWFGCHDHREYFPERMEALNTGLTVT